MLKIVYVVTGLARAGAESQVKDLALAMVERGHRVDVVSLMAPREFVDELMASGVRVSDLGMQKAQKHPLSFFKAALGLRRLIRRLQPDLVHSHMVHANLVSRIALGPFGNWPLICTAHNTHEGGGLRDWAYRLTNWASDLDTTISIAATRRFVGDKVFRAGKTLTVYNGLDVERYGGRCDVAASDPDAGFNWLAVGRLHEQKDYPTLLAALGDLPGAQLDIAGEGDLLGSLMELVQDYGLTGRVRFLGLRRDIAELMPRYNGFVLSSAWEGFGLVLAEAMASRLPVVATLSGGPQEIVGNDESAGFLVPPKDPKSLSAAMGRIMQLSVADRQIMGTAGRARVKAMFATDGIVAQWLEIYRQVVAHRKSV